MSDIASQKEFVKALVDEVKQLNETDKEKMSDAGRAVVNAVLSGHDITHGGVKETHYSTTTTCDDGRSGVLKKAEQLE